MARYDFVSSAEVRAIFERAARGYDLLFSGEDDDDDDDDDDFEEYDSFADQVIEALRFCAHAAGALRDPSLADVVFRTLDMLDRFDDYAVGHQQTAYEALSSLLKAGLSADKRVVELASSSAGDLRRAIAKGLDPSTGPGRALLERLATDPVADVRKAAKESLASIAEVPWWAGKWASDPAARLLPGEVEVAGPALRRASELLDLPQYALFDKEKSAFAELCAELQKLPQALAVEAIEHLFRLSERYYFEQMRPLFQLLLERDGGAEAFVRLLEQWGTREHAILYHSALAQALKAAPFEPRLAVCQRLLSIAAAAPLVKRLQHAENPEWLAASVLGEAWPPEADVSPVLDVVLAFGEEEVGEFRTDFVRCGLVDVFDLEVDPLPVLERVCEARIKGFQGPWRHLGHRVEKLLSRGPRDVLRRTAERAMLCEEETLRWAMLKLLGPVYDAEKDGPLDARVAAMLAEPRLRAAFLKDSKLVDRGLPQLRQELRAGGLGFRAAVEVVESIGRVHGGLAESAEWAFLRGQEDSATRRRAAREEVAAFLGPEELQGPPTEVEWEALRRAREAFTPEDDVELGRLWMRVLREGAWSAEERAVFDAMLEKFRKGDQELGFVLARALTSKPEEGLAALFEEIIEGSPPNMRPLLREYRRTARAALGLAPVKKARGGGEDAGQDEEEGDKPPGDDWDDEDSDEDDV